MAEGILKSKITGLDIEVDSAGTSGYHEGENPDARAVHTLRKKGINIGKLTSRPFTVEDFDQFDLIFAMDGNNYRDVLQMARNETDRSKVHLMLNELYPGSDAEVPDPYFGGPSGFEEVYKMLDEATDKLLMRLQK